MALVVGAAGGALERGWPSANNPAAVARFIVDNRAAILAQSMLFLLSSAAYVWFLGSLRSFLSRAEENTGRLSIVVFGAGIIWAGISMVAQAVQIGVAMTPTGEVPPAMLWTMAAVFGVANLPLAVMLMTVSVISLRNGAFPVWLGWLSVVAAAGELVLWFGTIVDSGPLAPNGWLTYALYPVFAVWLVATTMVMIKRIRKRTFVEGEASRNAA